MCRRCKAIFPALNVMPLRASSLWCHNGAGLPCNWVWYEKRRRIRSFVPRIRSWLIDFLLSHGCLFVVDAQKKTKKKLLSVFFSRCCHRHMTSTRYLFRLIWSFQRQCASTDDTFTQRHAAIPMAANNSTKEKKNLRQIYCVSRFPKRDKNNFFSAFFSPRQFSTRFALLSSLLHI